MSKFSDKYNVGLLSQV